MSESDITKTDKPTETDLVPLSIERNGENLIVIRWSDNTVVQWSTAELRMLCPCATCREKKRGEQNKASDGSKPAMLPVLSAAEAQPLRIESMRPVGSYAYSISFSDGHSSGIFPFALLHEKSVEGS